jgi:putative heme-binding domain-containing protein
MCACRQNRGRERDALVSCFVFPTNLRHNDARHGLDTFQRDTALMFTSFARTVLLITMVTCAAILGLTVSGAGQPKQPPTAVDLLKDVKVPKGYQATIFAAPPEVSYPTCLACAPTGEVFVGIDQNGSLDAKPGRGKVVRLVDTTGTGKADQITEFCKVDSPRGLIWDHNVLYVLHPPDLTAFYDDEGKGVANRSKVLVKGIGRDLKFRGADHTTNGIRMGIDGWIYIAVGDYGFPNAVGSDGKSLTLRGGGIVRVRPDGSELEIVCQQLRNIFDVAIDPYLNLFTRDNTNDGDLWDVRLNHDTPLGRYGYPTLFLRFGDEIIQPLADYGGGAPTGALFMDEPGFPADTGRTLLTCDWGRSIVYRHPLKANGSTFAIEQMPFVQLTRPTGIAVDGQGRLYIASWRGASYTYAGPNVGYVARVTYPSSKVEPFPDLTKASDADLLNSLASTSHVRRLATQREILRRGPKPAFTHRLVKLAEGEAPLAVRVAAIFTFKQLLGSDSNDYLLRLVKDDAVREFALHALADRRADAAKLPLEPFQAALADTNPRVRLQAIIALARIGKHDAAPSLIPLTIDKDAVMAHTAIQALVELHGTDACLAELNKPYTPHALACARVLQNFHEPGVVDGLLERFGKAEDPIRRPALFRALCRLYYREEPWDGKSWWGTRPDTSGPYYKPVKWGESERIGAALRYALANADKEALRWVLPELVRHKIDLPDLSTRLVAAAQADPAFRVAIVDLLVTGKKVPREAIALLEEVATSTSFNVTPALRGKVVRGLGRVPGEEGTEAALRALAKLGDPAKTQGLAELIREFTTDTGNAKKLNVFLRAAHADSAAQRYLAYVVLLNLRAAKNPTQQVKDASKNVLTGALQDPERAAAALKAIGVTRSKEFAPRVTELLKSDRQDVQAAAADAVKLLGLDSTTADRTPLVKSLAYDDIVSQATRLKGDSGLGELLFVKQTCIACHTVSKNEPVKGPYLGDVTARYKRPELVESILRPSAKIAQGFETHVFTMTDGVIVTGFVVRESGDEVEIRENDGTARVLKKQEIDERHQTRDSVMPEGLAETLTVHELASILAYLEALNKK